MGDGTSGAAVRIAHLERLFDRAWAVADYWKVRALRAEGHDIPAREHPGKVDESGRRPSDGE